MATFPPVRACLFDMDGLLLNTEDLYTQCANIVLHKHGRPPLPWSIKAQMMGIPGSSNGDAFHLWAKLPITREQFKAEQAEQHALLFPDCQALPGVKKLLKDLRTAKNTDGYSIQMALATSCVAENFYLKTRRPSTWALLHLIPHKHHVLGDDPRVKSGRGKPAPDIYLAALKSINEALPPKEPKITPAECIVFEDSVLGVEAGRRAGMRTVWVPHPELLAEYEGKEAEVLAGWIGLCPIGHEEQLGEIGDGWGEQLPSLENFPYEKYGIVLRGS
ncbi:HAD-like protein [Xylariaceae sp. FL1272]|nr:HAD-like protein [Xylariaceae sp. FL1272]